MKKNLRTASICVQGGYEPKNGEPIELHLMRQTFTLSINTLRDLTSKIYSKKFPKNPVNMIKTDRLCK